MPPQRIRDGPRLTKGGHSMSDIDKLLELKFADAGVWKSRTCQPHRHLLIKREPGIYAFVVDQHICYIGLSKNLYRRLRSYRNRCFGRFGMQDPREPHTGISNTIDGGREVHVYVCLTDPDVSLIKFETALRRKFRPPWDGMNKNSN